MISAVFLDRDGVINVNIPRGYVTSPETLELLPGVAEAIKRLNDEQIPVLIISNQQGVGKGLMTREQLDDVDSTMRRRLADLAGAEIIKSYYCTHLSNDGCGCRKPRGGQLRTAAAEFGINLATAIFVGDSPTDMQAGADASVGELALVLSGAIKSYVKGTWPVEPHGVHRDLISVVEYILNRNNA